MPRIDYLLATCSNCGQTTQVTQKVWPATYYEPADGEMQPEECEECGEEFGEETQWQQDEPPDRY